MGINIGELDCLNTVTGSKQVNWLLLLLPKDHNTLGGVTRNLFAFNDTFILLTFRCIRPRNLLTLRYKLYFVFVLHVLL